MTEMALRKRKVQKEPCYWANFILLTVIGRNKYILAPKPFNSTQNTHTQTHTHTHTHTTLHLYLSNPPPLLVHFVLRFSL